MSFLAPKGYTLKRLNDYKRSWEVQVISEKVNFVFGLMGHVIHQSITFQFVVTVRYEILINHLAQQPVNPQILSCTDDVR